MRIKYSVGRTVNIGNFESLRFDVGAERTPDAGQDPLDVYDELKRWCDTRMDVLTAPFDGGAKKNRKKGAK